MVKALKIILLFIVIAAMAAASAIGYTLYQGRHLDENSKAFVDDKVPEIFLAWDDKRLYRLASPEFQQANSPEELAKMLATLRTKLGSMKKYHEASGQAMVMKSFGGESKTTALYRSDIEFEQGRATVELSLVLKDSNWLIHGLNLKSSVFAQ